MADKKDIILDLIKVEQELEIRVQRQVPREENSENYVSVKSYNEDGSPSNDIKLREISNLQLDKILRLLRE